MHATRRALDNRMHFAHGPIDLIIEAWGAPAAVAAAHEAAWARFQTILTELVSELPLLRQRLRPETRERQGRKDRQERQQAQQAQLRGAVARRMHAACLPHAAQFITPMAAVAGAVADEIATAYAGMPGVRKACINNGGDIALVLREHGSLDIGVVADPRVNASEASTRVEAWMPVRGVATSGWRGRSLSLGIADAVTVLAKNAATADAAATMIANAVNVDHPGIVRLPACDVRDETDLGRLLVTRDVPTLPADARRMALINGLQAAQELIAGAEIASAVLTLQGEWHTAGEWPVALSEAA